MLMLQNRLKLVIGLKCIKGPLFLKILKEKYEITKKLFLQEVQDGGDVFIPQDLSQNRLPWSFRYYDPLLLNVTERMGDEKKDFFKLQNKLKTEIYGSVDTKKKILQ